MRRKAALQQAIEALEGLDQVRRRVAKAKKHAKLLAFHLERIEETLGSGQKR